MQLDMDMDHNSNIEVMVLESWSVGHAVRNTLREIVDIIMVVGLIYIVHKRRRLLGMLVMEFLIYMQQWTIDRETIMHLSLRWKVRFVNK